MQLRDFQLEGIRFLQDRQKAYLCDEMGLGKTVQAICAADRVGAKRILVLCPASLQYNWRNEFSTWQHINRSFYIHATKQQIPQNAGIVIMNYEKLLDGATFNQLMTQNFDLLIADEAHRLKNHKSKRTNLVIGPKHDGHLGVASRCARVWWLSGTPAPNDASELYTAMKFMDQWAGSFWTFQREFCVLRQTNFGMKVVGARNTDKLKTHVQSVSKRRTAFEVLKELPEITYSDVKLTPTSVVNMAASNGTWLKMLADNGICLDGHTDEEVVEFLRRDSTELAKLRHLIGVAKAPEIAALVRNDLDTTSKVLVFGWHRAVIETLANALSEYMPAVITGNTPNDLRQVEVDRFQKDQSCRVFIGNILAAGEGITLTAGNVVIFAEQSWVPKDNVQAAKRAHRIGQKRPVLVKFCSFPGTVDDIITRAVARKTATLSLLELS